jgi:muramoyltetrapeptide carboxypeptidase
VPSSSAPLSLRIPPALRPGDLVTVVAPSGPFEATPAWLGLAWLRERYRVRFDRGMFGREGYLAGSDERRGAELAAALADPDVRLVLAARGGYGANRYAHTLDWSALRERPRWIAGFSDVTALHVEAAAVGVASLHACHATALGRGDAATREAFLRALEHPTAERRFAELEVLREGAAEGPLFGGNLTLLHACAAAGRLRVPDGAVVLLEDVGERPYRIDRALTTLLAGGHFARASAFVLGDFDQCGPNADGVTVLDVARTLLVPLGAPVIAGVPVGHGARNEPVVLGGRARVEARGSSASLTLGG